MIVDYKVLEMILGNHECSNHQIKVLFDFMGTFDNYDKKYDCIENIIVKDNILDEIKIKILGLSPLYWYDEIINDFVFNVRTNILIINFVNGNHVKLDIDYICGFGIVKQIDKYNSVCRSLIIFG